MRHRVRLAPAHRPIAHDGPRPRLPLNATIPERLASTSARRCGTSSRFADAVGVPDSVAGSGGVSFAAVSEHRSATDAHPVKGQEGIWARNERIRVAELRADGERPMGALLEEGVELSRFASELAATAPER